MHGLAPIYRRPAPARPFFSAIAAEPRDLSVLMPNDSICLTLHVIAFDRVAVQLVERHERHEPTVVDIGTLDRDLAAGAGLLDHFEDTLGARRADRDHHDAAGFELLKQGRRNVIDAAGDDDLVER